MVKIGGRTKAKRMIRITTSQIIVYSSPRVWPDIKQRVPWFRSLNPDTPPKKLRLSLALPPLKYIDSSTLLIYFYKYLPAFFFQCGDIRHTSPYLIYLYMCIKLLTDSLTDCKFEEAMHHWHPHQDRQVAKFAQMQ